MNQDTTKTISQIAKELGVTRQAVHQKIKKDAELSTALQPFLTTVNNTLYISNEGKSILKAAFSKNQNKASLQEFTDNSLQIQVDSLQAQINAKNDEIEVLKGTIETLKQQLAAQNEQIKALQADLSKERQHSREIAETFTELTAQAQKLADQAQQLNAADKQKLLTIEEQPEPERKPTFWERFRKRGKQ